MKGQAIYLCSFLIVLSISLTLLSSIPSKAFIAHSQQTKTSDTWVSLSPMPTARAQLGIAAANGKIYAIGGSANDPESGPALLNITEEYDPATDSWATKASMPTARHSFGVAVFQNKIYCMGGSTNDQVLAVNEAYDPATDTWETKVPMPTARSASSANTVNGKIYLMGGNPENTTNEAYDPTTDSWTTEAKLSLDSIYSESAVVDNKIYVFGGLSNRNVTQIYDPRTDTWSFGASIPTGVAEGAAAATTGVNVPVRIYVMGGEATYVNYGHTFGNVTDLNQVYNPESNTWTMEAPLPAELCFFALANVNDTLYAIGGFPKVIDFLSTNYGYTPLGYETIEQESSPQIVVLVGIITIVVVVILAAILTILSRKHGRLQKSPDLFHSGSS